MGSLPHTELGASHISARSSVAVHLAAAYANGPAAAFIARTEFAHLHADGSGSLHMTLPEGTADEAIAKGWAERHPAATAGLAPPTLVMVYGPRDDAELEQVWALVQRSYTFARETQNASGHYPAPSPASVKTTPPTSKPTRDIVPFALADPGLVVEPHPSAIGIGRRAGLASRASP